MFKMPVLELSEVSFEEQKEKIFEEFIEVSEASDGGNPDDICSECLDLIQSALGLLFKVAPKAHEQARCFLRHELKLQQREAHGKFKIIGWLKIEHHEGY